MGMKPTWESDCGTVKLWLGDCLEVMKSWPDGAVDAVVTDPPYGIGINKSNRLSVSRGFAGETWDETPADAAAIEWCLRQKQVIIWGGNYFDLPLTKCWIVWDKQNDGRDFADFEMAWSNLACVARLHRQRPMNMDGGKVHPTQKPIHLMQKCIAMTTGVVTDLFMGSGTTGVACVRLGRQFWGVEIDPNYFEIAKRRIQDELKRLDFLEPDRVRKQRELFE